MVHRSRSCFELLIGSTAVQEHAPIDVIGVEADILTTLQTGSERFRRCFQVVPKLLQLVQDYIYT